MKRTKTSVIAILLACALTVSVSAGARPAAGKESLRNCERTILHHAVVEIFESGAGRKDRAILSKASGTIIAETKSGFYLLANAHTIPLGEHKFEIDIRYLENADDEDFKTATASLLGAPSLGLDVALLFVPKEKNRVARLAPAAIAGGMPEAGERIWISNLYLAEPMAGIFGGEALIRMLQKEDPGFDRNPAITIAAEVEGVLFDGMSGGGFYNARCEFIGLYWGHWADEDDNPPHYAGGTNWNAIREYLERIAPEVFGH